MATQGPAGSGLEVLALDSAAAARRARELADLTRAGFSRADPYPGLPLPDGARERADDVAADCAGGARFWVARSAAGEPVGVVRVLPLDDGRWEVRRLAVPQAWRRIGVARALMDRVHADADACAVDLTLDAVVERGNPVFYARLGYRTVSHWPSLDKPLSEVSMVLDALASRSAFAHPWEGDDVIPGPFVQVTWLSARSAVHAVVTDSDGAVAATALRAASHVQKTGRSATLALLGVDVSERSPEPVVRALARNPAAQRKGHVVSFGRDASAIAPFVMPREGYAAALAWWRVPGGVSLQVDPRGKRGPA